MNEIALPDIKRMEEIENDLIKDEIALAILFELGKNVRVGFLKLLYKFPDDVKPLLKDKIKILEVGEYIKQNPSRDENKPFESRVYMVDLKGIFFINKLRNLFPEYLKSVDFLF